MCMTLSTVNNVIVLLVLLSCQNFRLVNNNESFRYWIQSSPVDSDGVVDFAGHCDDDCVTCIDMYSWAWKHIIYGRNGNSNAGSSHILGLHLHTM
jgi:hypothetical protein